MHKSKQLLLAALVAAGVFPHGLAAQEGAAPPAEAPRYNGIFEPVNYAQDLQLTDVFFVNEEVGWVAAARGTVLHTRDGGRTWAVQLGGDPQAQEPAIEELRFLDSMHGWALQGVGIGQYRLLRTTDGGERWEQAGTIEARWGLVGYQFSSASQGVYVDGNDNVARIMHTTDGGRSWREVFPAAACVSSLAIDGLHRQMDCRIRDLHMVSASVGYAVGDYSHPAPDALAVLKTEDGGATWSLWAIPDAGDVRVPVGTWQTIFFIDESTGFLQVGGSTGATKLLTTEDGGRSWRAIVGSAGRKITFADPQVGWSFDRFGYGRDYTLHYTTDGGRRWTSRALRFPAEVSAVSLPRRDTAYVVGNHGMIYRYRLVAMDYSAPNIIDAPPMPGASAVLLDRMNRTEQSIEVAALTLDDTRSSGFALDADDERGEELGFLERCCEEAFDGLESTVSALLAEVPAAIARYRSLNLTVPGLQQAGDLRGGADGVRASFAAAKAAADAETASAALEALSVNLHSTRQAYGHGFADPPPLLAGEGERASDAVESTADGEDESTRDRLRRGLRRLR